MARSGRRTRRSRPRGRPAASGSSVRRIQAKSSTTSSPCRTRVTGRRGALGGCGTAGTGSTVAPAQELLTRDSAERVTNGSVPIMMRPRRKTAAARASGARYPQPDAGGPMRGRRIAGGGGSGAAGRGGAARYGGHRRRRDSGPPADEKVTFTVGITQDVDSLNPFTGIVVLGVRDLPAAVRDAHRLRREGLLRRSRPWPRAGTSSDDGLTWTYHLRDGLTWSDGEPLTANDVAYTFNRVRDGKYEQTNFGNYVERADLGGGHRRPHRGHEGQEADADHAAPLRLHPPRAHLEGHRREGGQELRQRARTRRASSAPARSRSSEHKKGQFIRLEANESYYKGAPHIDELVFRVFQNQDSLAQALRRGEIDFADRPQRERLRQPQGRRGREDLPGEVLRVRRDRVQHRGRARRRHADRRRPPGAQGRQAAPGAVATRSTPRRWSSGCSAATARRAAA